jgi:hydrogenase nickel incorporation protein HypA/HybF
VHELSLAESLLQIIEEQAGRQHFKRVRQVVLAVGRLTCVEPWALEFCFALSVAGTVAEGADLKIVPIEGRGRCPTCLKEEVLEELCQVCAQCRVPLEVVAGLEIRLQELIVE